MLDQRQRDVLGLALSAAGIFMGFILYGGWNGGRAGHGIAVALGWTLGGARVLAPVALVLGGGVALLRPVLPAVRPLRTGAICVFCSLTLALAAGTLGVSAGARAGHIWGSAHLQSHGGVVGQALYELADRLVQNVGVNILVVFLMLAGVILLTGASLAGVIRATGNGLIDTTRMVRAIGERPQPQRSCDPLLQMSADESLAPPEPTPQELIVLAPLGARLLERLLARARGPRRRRSPASRTRTRPI